MKNSKVKALILATVMTTAPMGTLVQAQNAAKLGGDGDIARLYDQIDAAPTLKEGSVIIGNIRGNVAPITAQEVSKDPCSDPQLFELCEIAGKDTIRKIRNFSWSLREDRHSSQEPFAKKRKKGFGREPDISVQAALLDYGIRKQLEKHYGTEGVTDAEEDRMDGLAAAKLTKDSKALRTFLGCKRDERSINYGLFSLFPKHRLTTCHWHLSVRLSFWIFSAEAATGITNSRFARKVIAWIPNGASNITARTEIGSNIGQAPFITSNSNNWLATSVGARFVFNKPAMTLQGKGSANELGTNFNLTLP